MLQSPSGRRPISGDIVEGNGRAGQSICLVVMVETQTLTTAIV